MLLKFYILVPELYPLQVCSSVTHNLIHIPQFVRTCGPLWRYSMFGYENMNGHLKKLIHGIRNVLDQLVFSYQLERSLPLLRKKLEEKETPQAVRYLQNREADETGSQIGENTYIVGKVKHKLVNTDVQTSLREAGAMLRSEELPVFFKIKRNHVIYHSQSLSKRRGVRNSTVCMFIDPSTAEICFRSIELFFFAMNTPVTVIQVFETTNQDPLAELRTPQLQELQSGYHLETLKKFIFVVKKPSLSSRTRAIPTSNIISRCVFIPMKYSPTDYILPQPNTFEHL